MLQKEKREWLLREAPVQKALLSLALPSMLAMIVASVYSFADVYFIGKLADTNAMAAVSICFPLFVIVVAIGQTVGVGAASYVGRKLGSGETAIAYRTAALSLVLSLGLGIATTVAILFFLKPLLGFLGASPQVMPYALRYATVLIGGSVFTVVNIVFNNLIRAEGAARRGMATLMLSSLLNIALDPLFIFTFKLGLTGAALATIVAQAITLVYCVLYYTQKKSLIPLNKPLFFTRTPTDKSSVTEIFKIGLPVFVMQGLTSVSFGILNTEAALFGAAAVAAFGIVNKVYTIVMQLMAGFTQAYMPFVSYNFGAKNIGRVKKGTTFALFVVVGIGLVATLLFQAFPQPIVSLFSGDSALIPLATNGLKAQTYALTAVGFILIMTVFFQGAGMATKAAILTVGRQGALLIPAALFLPRLFAKGVPPFVQLLVRYPMEGGLYGVMLAQTLTDLLTFLMALWMSVVVFKALNRGDLLSK